MISEKLERLFDCLPERLTREIKRIEKSNTDFEKRLHEIRIRSERISTLNLQGRSIPLSVIISKEEISESLKRLCRGSVYAYSESLREGFVSFSGGYRIGVAGKAVYEDGILMGVNEVGSLCIRIPHNINGAGDIAVDTFEKMNAKRGILVYSRPRIGKTTVLRDAAITLSSKKQYCVALVDTREELSGDFIGARCEMDILSGYGKAEGIEIATRTLSPDLIVCDEIGGYEEAESILSVASAGVPLLASAHGDSLEEVLSRGAIRILADAKIFGAYIGVNKDTVGRYTYTVDYS
jgi:stage III sporulation protein AA